jgi:aerobic carbon-monoxide dehydrogenase medium subunit
MNDFGFQRPKTLAEAVAAKKKAPDGKFLGGGQSLLPVLKLDMAAPTDLISLTGLTELKGITTDGPALIIGAGSTHAEVAASTVVKSAIPALAELAGHIGDAQVRNRGTLGGSLAHADPSADYPAAVVGLKGTVRTDRRAIAADDFFKKGMFETALASDEVVVGVKFEKPEKAAYAKFPNPASKYAVVGVLVAKYADGVRVAVTGAGASVFRIKAMEDALGKRFAPEALDGIQVSSEGLNSEIGADAEYRAHLIGVMAKRAVAAAR